jgi:crotonobetainyl-CoA:carnitine CoA-transferase CaiB-like acyl-CoA transferase
MKPMQGIRVIDLSSVVFGPMASQVFADYGADVVKIEPPTGDSTRYTGPGKEPGMAGIYLSNNHSKRSVVLDLKKPEAQAVLRRLCETADVLMANIRPQKLPSLGIDAADLMARNPRLVYASLLGFGEGGPYAGRPAYDDIVQGMTGIPHLVERVSGEVRYMPTIVADKSSALTVAHAVLAALLGRERTGRGCHVEIPMFETLVGWNLIEHGTGMMFEPPIGPAGYGRVLDRWRKPYSTADGHVGMMPYSNANWRDFFAVVGEPQIAQDPRFTDMDKRTKNIQALLELAGGFIAKYSTAFWLETCERLQIPVAAIASLDDLRTDPHLEAVGFWQMVEDPAMGTLRIPGVPVKFDGERPGVTMPPRLGEHTRELLEDAGYGAEEIEALLGSGAAVQHAGLKATD